MKRQWEQEVERTYGIHIDRYHWKRDACILETDQGTNVLKGYSSVSKAHWVTTLSEYLRERGFVQTVRYIPDKSGAMYVKGAEKSWTLMSFVEGKDLSFSRAKRVDAIMRCLGRFHRHAVGVPVQRSSLSFDAIPMYRKWTERLRVFSEMISGLQHPLTEMENMILALAPEAIHDALQALRALQGSHFHREIVQARKARQVVHRDVAAHNFRRHSNGDVYLMDLDMCSVDSPLTDLIQVLDRILSERGWRPEIYTAALAAYERERPLTQRQRRYIVNFLRFPDAFFREVNGFLNGKKGYQRPFASRYVEGIYRRWHQRPSFFHEVGRVFEAFVDEATPRYDMM